MRVRGEVIRKWVNVARYPFEASRGSRRRQICEGVITLFALGSRRWKTNGEGGDGMISEL